MDEKHSAVVAAVNFVKNCPYKATGLKVEFEANLNRNDDCATVLNNFLSELDGSTDLYEEDTDEAYITNPLPEIAYARCYNDGSVDTEITFTVKLDNPENVFILPRAIEAFRKVCSEAGSDFDVTGAGMHMALINDKDCHYPTRNSDEDKRRFENFGRAMILAQPALYFLAAADETTRGLSWRRPCVFETNAAHGYTKGGAIVFKSGAIEFRVFDTCYKYPQMILDNVVVIANSMKYWTDKYTNPGLSKIANNVKFGVGGDYSLARLYVTVDHIKLLEAGLQLLKPSYLTIEQLKQQRKFDLDEQKLAEAELEVKRKAELEYREYSDRYDWDITLNMQYSIVDEMNKLHAKDKTIPMRSLRAKARTSKAITDYVESRKRAKSDLNKFVGEKVNQYLHRNIGEYELAA